MSAHHELQRRARPWLGTLVEVATAPSIELSLPPTSPSSPSPSPLQVQNWREKAARAIESAFSAIARVDASMSFQSPTSELSHFNGLKPGQWLSVSGDVMAVMAFSVELSALTNGAFDVCCTGADWRCVTIDYSRQKIGKSAPLTVDLSGVAKGYAVDCGVSALKACGIENGWVNAGGDVRVFGALDLPLQVRSPTNAAQLYDCGTLHNASAATSASYLLNASVLRQGASRRLVNKPASWTVCAPACMTADALTKVLAADSPQYRAVFEHYSAQGWIFD